MSKLLYKIKNYKNNNTGQNGACKAKSGVCSVESGASKAGVECSRPSMDVKKISDKNTTPSLLSEDKALDLLQSMHIRLAQYPSCDGVCSHIKNLHPKLWKSIKETEGNLAEQLTEGTVVTLEKAYITAIEQFYSDTAPESCRGCWANAGRKCFRDIRVEPAQPDTCPHTDKNPC